MLVIERCEHDLLTNPPTDADGKELEYYSKNEKSFKVLRKLIMDDKWLQSMKYYTKFRFVKIYIILLEHVNVHFLDTPAVLNHFIIWYWPMHPSVLLSSNLSYIYMIYNCNICDFSEIYRIILGYSWLFWITMHIWIGHKLRTNKVNICIQGNFASKVKNGIQHQP